MLYPSTNNFRLHVVHLPTLNMLLEYVSLPTQPPLYTNFFFLNQKTCIIIKNKNIIPIKQLKHNSKITTHSSTFVVWHQWFVYQKDITKPGSINRPILFQYCWFRKHGEICHGMTEMQVYFVHIFHYNCICWKCFMHIYTWILTFHMHIFIFPKCWKAEASWQVTFPKSLFFHVDEWNQRLFWTAKGNLL